MEAVFDSLRRLDGVHDVKIDLQRNLVTITPAPDRIVELARIPRAIRAAGFRPGILRLRGRGTIEPSPDGPRVRFAGWPHAFAWSGTEALPPGRSFVARMTEGPAGIVLTPDSAPEGRE